MKSIIVCLMTALTALVLVGKPAPHVRVGIVSDWTHHHVLYPESNDHALMARVRRDPRWVQSWYLRHLEKWWPIKPPKHPAPEGRSRRDWSVPLGTAAFEPLFDFTFDINTQSGYGSLNTIDQGNGEFLAVAGTLTVTGANDIGTYPLYPGGPGVTTSPQGAFIYDNLLYPFYPQLDPSLDVDGLLFTGNGLEINIWGNSPGSYTYYDHNGSGYVDEDVGAPFTLTTDPGGGQTFPTKYVFDVTAAPSCTNDFVVIGIPASPASGGQANIVGLNNLYSTSASTGYCPTSGPTVMFAYASGTGQVPASVSVSESGQQIAFVENLPTGSSYFHVLTLGTTGSNGTSATAAVVPGSAGGNNAVDQTVLLSPDGGVTNQSSTNAPFLVYTPNDANDAAFVTTYSTAGTGSGYLYKIGNVFNGGATPTIVWSAPIDAIPSSPIYDAVSNNIFFTDSGGRIDYVTDTGASPAVVYGAVVAPGATSENPVTVDSVNQMVYATFNSDGTNAVVVQAPTSMASTVSVAVGAMGTIYTGPYGVDFNNAWYTGSGTPLMYVAGTGTGALPTLYSVGFGGSGVMNSTADPTTAALAGGLADASPVTEFYNASLQKDFLFVGVTNNCIANVEGGGAGCVMSLDITDGFPAVNAGSTALAAPGGSSGIIVDNDSSLNQASNIYFATKTGATGTAAATLVKATQSSLN